MAPPPPALLTDDIVGEFLLRLPADDPASLVRAALVCKPWCTLISGAVFRRRFRERHRRAPMLGFFDRSFGSAASFFPTSSFRPRNADLLDRRVLDSRHGRVLLASKRNQRKPTESHLAVWDPITGELLDLPRLPPYRNWYITSWNAAVLCASSLSGGCNHLDCDRGRFLVVLVCTTYHEVVVYVYTSEDGAWGEPTSTEQNHADPIFFRDMETSALVGNTLYFLFDVSDSIGILKYDFSTREASKIHLPPDCSDRDQRVVLTTTEHGGLGFARVENSRLYLWSREAGPNGYSGWAQSRVIELKKMLSANACKLLHFVAAFAHGLDVLFLSYRDGLFSIDLKSSHVKKEGEGFGTNNVVPYISFYTPALGAAFTGEELIAGVPSA